MIYLDSIARRYGTTPSRILGMPDDSFQALSINIWAHNWAVQEKPPPLKRTRRR